ncbi:MAG TPA: SDR family oxidoreductase [Amycolatopsis sp.]|nr:SDR family oxidoreductase [Amycolatopsis sp.]
MTGAGGDGLGNAISHRLAEQGATVVVLDVNDGAGKFAADDVAKRWNVPTLAVTANVGDRAQAAAAVETAVREFGTVDLLVNNAGGSGSIGLDGQGLPFPGHFSDNSAEYIDTTVLVNFTGVLNMTKEVLKVMLPKGSGRVINIASEGGKTGMRNLAVYNACKAAVIGFTRNLAYETGPQGVSVVAVCPGIMVSQRLLDAPVWEDGSAIEQSYRRVSVGRCSLPDDVASAVAFLASRAGAYIHGTAVSLGGGLAD